MKHRLMLLVATALMASQVATYAQTRKPAAARFHSAYRTLIQADIARDEQRFSDAVEHYSTAGETYARLMRDYPDWEPGATRFRLQHCQQELKRLKRLLEENRADTGGRRPTTPAPAARTPVNRLLAIKITGVELLEQDKPEEARQMLLDGMDVNPDDVGLRVLLGIAQCHAGRHHDALFLLRNVVEEEPDNAHAHAALGAAYFGLARYADAASEMTKASDSNPALCEPHFNLAQVLLAMDPPDPGGASYHYRKSLNLGGKRDATLEKRLQTASEPAKKAPAPASVRVPTPSKRPSPPVEPTPLLRDPESIASPAESPDGTNQVKKTWLRSIAPW